MNPRHWAWLLLASVLLLANGAGAAAEDEWQTTSPISGLPLPSPQRKPVAGQSVAVPDYSQWTLATFEAQLAALYEQRDRTAQRTAELAQRLAEAGASAPLSNLHFNSLKAALAQASLELTDINRSIAQLQRFMQIENPALAKSARAQDPLLAFMAATWRERDSLAAIRTAQQRALTLQADDLTAARQRQLDLATALEAADRQQQKWREQAGNSQQSLVELSTQWRATVASQALNRQQLSAQAESLAQSGQSVAVLQQALTRRQAEVLAQQDRWRAAEQARQLAASQARDLAGIVADQRQTLTMQADQLAGVRKTLAKSQDAALNLDRRWQQAVAQLREASAQNQALTAQAAQIRQVHSTLQSAFDQSQQALEQARRTSLRDAAARAAQQAEQRAEQAAMLARLSAQQADLAAATAQITNSRTQLAGALAARAAAETALAERTRTQQAAEAELVQQRAELARLQAVERSFNAQGEALARARARLTDQQQALARLGGLEAEIADLESALADADRRQRQSALASQALAARDQEIAKLERGRSALEGENDRLRAEIAALQLRDPTTVIQLAFQGSNGPVAFLPAQVAPPAALDTPDVVPLRPIGSRDFLTR